MKIKAFQYFLACTWTIIIICLVAFTILGVTLRKEYLINKKRKTEANLILTGDKLTSCINEACSPGGCETQKDWKKAYYKVFGKKTACAVALYKAKLEQLKGAVPYPRHQRCYQTKDTELFEQEGLNYKDLKEKYLGTDKVPEVKLSNEFKIPPKLNFVWVTSDQRTKKENEKFFYKHNEYIFHNTKITPKWEHTLWTNNIDWIPDSAQEELKTKKIKLRSIDEIDMQNSKHRALKSLAKEYAIQHKWGLSSDIARVLVEYYEGGVYVDGDFNIFKPAGLEKYIKSYRSFFGVSDYSPEIDLFVVMNAFIASEARGEILGELLRLMYRNTIDLVNAPNYVKYPCDQFTDTLFKTGPISLTVAFASKQIDGQDVVLPQLLRRPYDSFSFIRESYGKDSSRATWETEGMKKRLIY